MNVSKYDNKQIEQASRIALWSLLNLTFLPLISFIVLLSKINKFTRESFVVYHLHFAIKLNLAAAVALLLVSGLMLYFGGFNSGMTWVFVITYFISKPHQFPPKSIFAYILESLTLIFNIDFV